MEVARGIHRKTEEGERERDTWKDGGRRERGIHEKTKEGERDIPVEREIERTGRHLDVALRYNYYS